MARQEPNISARAESMETAQEISPDKWIPFLAEFTRRNRGAHAVIEVLNVEDVGYEVETENRQLDGVAADVKDQERTVWINFISPPDQHFAHSIARVTDIYWRPADGGLGEALQILSDDESKTILDLTPPEVYALPKGGS